MQLYSSFDSCFREYVSYVLIRASFSVQLTPIFENLFYIFMLKIKTAAELLFRARGNQFCRAKYAEGRL